MVKNYPGFKKLIYTVSFNKTLRFIHGFHCLIELATFGFSPTSAEAM